MQKLADKNYALLKQNPKHPSLHFKQVNQYWSVRVGEQFRAVGIEIEEGLLWFWIGTHTEYDKLIG
ncbi:ParE family toxin-like protein [Spirosoma profusum]